MSIKNFFSRLLPVLLLAFSFTNAIAIPILERPNPPRLVNDFAHVMSSGEVQQLEQKLLAFENETSNQITIVTVNTLDGSEIGSYALELAQKWKIGQADKDNGILVFAAIKDRKLNITVGFGLEGAVPDGLTARIRTNEMNPYFKEGNYYKGFDKGTDALIKATKGEYKNDKKAGKKKGGGSVGAIVVIVVIIALIIRRRGGGGGGNYISRRGSAGLAEGFILGNLLSRGWGGGSSGGSSWGGGDSGGFGGGDFGGGGSSGDW